MKKKIDGRTPKKMRAKLKLILVLIFFLFGICIVRLIYWNVSKGHEFEKNVLVQQRHSSTELPYERGKIYDTNGKILATNERLYTLVLEPANILLKNSDGTYRENKSATINALATYMGIDSKQLTKDLRANEEKNPYYLEYKKNLTYDDISAMKQFMDKASDKKSEAESTEEKDLIKQAELVTGVYFVEEFKRVYPNNSLASHLLGFTSAGNEGQWGLESYYNEELNGVNGRTYAYLDEDLAMETTTKEPVDGNSIVTTLNLDIQKAIEARREAFDTETGSEMTSITVMDPNTGEVLGMTSSNEYDLNNPTDETLLSNLYSEEEIATFKANQEKVEAGETLERKNAGEILTTIDAFSSIWKNSIISDTFEPGSTFKPFTVASVLEEDIYDGTEGFSCPGYLVVGNTKIACSHTHGSIDFKDTIAQSCNVALMTMGLTEGKETFTKYQEIFGFGQKTGIDLPGEANTTNLLYDVDKMENVDLATNSFGQNFNVTGIQMISAFCSLINGGNYYQPHLVKQIVGADGNIVKNISKTLMKTTISKETSDELRTMMQETVLSGTGTKAAIEGYTVGGKTGTAEKITAVEKNGKTTYVRNKTDYLVSFIGFTPVENPELVIYVTIDEPHVDYQANAGLAVALERQCMEDIIGILDIKSSEETTSEETDTDETEESESEGGEDADITEE
ncbi:MAG: penicillin-binding transpeptidase domain-containing protein [Lachnospiraceae bacterium]|nr:penicillin-binding transpeptidase domain-containing protein [Lachnospiraceae bacterium]